MNKLQRWSQTEDGRPPITGFEVVRGLDTVTLAPYCEWAPPAEAVSVYYAEMVVCFGRIDGLPIHCGEILESGETCEHIAFADGRVRVLQTGIYQLAWRSFSPCRALRGEA